MAKAASGNLDTSFGDGGFVRTPIHDSSQAFAIDRQSDGKLIVAGCSHATSISQFVVARYTPSGSLDLSFGEEGVASVSFPGSSHTCWVGSHYGPTTDLAIRPDDKIMLAGSAKQDDGWQSFAVAQLTPNGQLDGGFGNDGRVLLHPGDLTFHASGRAIALDPDGRAIVAGEARTERNDGNPEIPSFAAVRIGPNGVIDPSFGEGGQLVLELTETTPSGVAVGSSVADIVRYPDGRIALVGSAYDDWPDDGDGQYRYRAAVVRLDDEGQLDPSFSDDGMLITPVRGVKDFARAHAAALGGAGRLTVGLRFDEHLGAARPLVARFEENGDPDLTFGANGSTLLDFEQSGDPHVVALDYQEDGKLVVAGTGDGNFYFAVARLDAAGALDPSFGSNGITLGPPSGADAWDRAWAQDLLLEPSGKIALAGFATGQSDPAQHLAVARYSGDSPPPPPPPPSLDPPPGDPPLSPPPPELPRRSLTVRAIGDSVTAGFGYDIRGRPASTRTIIRVCRKSPSASRCQSPHKIAYPGHFAAATRRSGRAVVDWHNYARSGSTPDDWLNDHRLKAHLGTVVGDNPDLTALTLGANPPLTDALRLGPLCALSPIPAWATMKLRVCVRAILAARKVTERTARVLKRLLTARNNHVVVLAYPGNSPVPLARVFVAELNRSVREAVRQVRTAPHLNKRILFISLGSFSKHGCLSRKPWILKADGCIHPNAAGHQQLAGALLVGARRLGLL